jgi:hypothetical protein
MIDVGTSPPAAAVDLTTHLWMAGRLSSRPAGQASFDGAGLCDRKVEALRMAAQTVEGLRICDRNGKVRALTGYDDTGIEADPSSSCDSASSPFSRISS